MNQQLLAALGIERQQVSHTERVVSAAGALCGMLAVFLTGTVMASGPQDYVVVASMGASAVLLFAVPHGALSQPWALVGGHVLAALVGVTCAQLITATVLAAPLAVGLTVAAMHYLRCIHPPGGATALAAVLGGAEQVGYGFVLAPVLINIGAILTVAILFNALFPWRRYPACFNRRRLPPVAPDEGISTRPIAHEDFVYALSEIDSFIDVSENDLLRIYDLATRRRGPSARA